MNKYKLSLSLIVACIGFSLSAYAQDSVSNNGEATPTDTGIWTQEMRENTQSAMPVIDAAPPAPVDLSSFEPSGPPTFQTSIPPTPKYGGPLGASRVQETFVLDETDPAAGIVPQGYTYPPPFSRWQVFRKYRKFPLGTVGKVFFQKANDASYVCSGVVIGPNMIQTAGHCVSEGDSTWHKNWQFCPGYDAGPNSLWGCWNGDGGASVSTAWHTTGNFDYDWGAFTLQSTGTVISDSINNVTGTMAKAWNFGDVHWMQFGYPHAAPFTGDKIVVCAGSRALTRDTDAGATGQDSDYIGCDMTGGSSGGPWIMNWNKASGNSAYECGAYAGGSCGVYTNGITSHRYGSEPLMMGGPHFRSSDTEYDIRDFWDFLGI